MTKDDKNPIEKYDKIDKKVTHFFDRIDDIYCLGASIFWFSVAAFIFSLMVKTKFTISVVTGAILGLTYFFAQKGFRKKFGEEFPLPILILFLGLIGATLLWLTHR